MDKKCYYIPRIINDNYVFIWKQDETLFLFLPTMFLLLMSVTGVVLTLLGIVVSTQTLKKLGENKPSGYLIHWLKFNLPKEFIRVVISRKPILTEHKKSLFYRSDVFPPNYIRHIAG